MRVTPSLQPPRHGPRAHRTYRSAKSRALCAPTRLIFAQVPAARHDVSARPREQYVSAPWPSVVIGGGLNDLNQDCDCGACDEVLDSIVSADGTRGDVPDLVDRARADGAGVVIVGYAEIDPEAKWGFGVCNAASERLEDRYRTLADLHDDVRFVDPSDVISLAETPNAYVRDGIHPSEAGSALVGELVAGALDDLQRLRDAGGH
ncbi:MAG: SGNH/GDSL hydrolase family protein [Myxococcota bacterium]